MNTINKVVVTSQHPTHKHVYTAKLGNTSFDVNIKAGTVWESMKLNKHTNTFRNVVVTNEHLKQYILKGVNKFINNSN